MRNGAPSRAVIDTSVFVSIEQGRPLQREVIPEVGAISIVTKAELRAGVLTARDIAARDRRLDTLDAVAGIAVLPVDEQVARAWAQMRAYLSASKRRVNVNDMWIAATAAAHEIPVVTQDGDFDALNGVAGLTVIPV
jgi:predicted nucleic acid-binding protein